MAAGAKSQGSSPLRSLVRGVGLLGPYYRMIELRRAMNYPKPPALAPDGKPLPNRLAMMRIGGVSDWKFFFERGRATAEFLVNAACEAGSDPAMWARALDWGCGCGRIARHMPALTKAKIIGRDIDAYTVKWCARNLDGDFKVSALQPPLDVAPGSIDFAYGFSVLTHLTAPMQARWLEELGRILKPGAIATLTYHDREHPAVKAVQFRREEAGVAVTEWAMEGSNLVAAFQDIGSITRAATPWFELVRNIPRDETLFDQAVAVLRRL